MLHLILGGAALQRCGNCFVLNSASAAEVTLSGQGLVFRQPVSGWASEIDSFRSPRDPRGLQPVAIPIDFRN